MRKARIVTPGLPRLQGQKRRIEAAFEYPCVVRRFGRVGRRIDCLQVGQRSLCKSDPLGEAVAAVKHAAQSQRTGKILFGAPEIVAQLSHRS